MNGNYGSNQRFTPSEPGQEDVIGDVIMNRDSTSTNNRFNEFIASRLNAQSQASSGISSNSNYDDGAVDRAININDRITNNHGYCPENQNNSQFQQEILNQDSMVETKVIKLRFEIDFQINLNINSK